MPVNTLSKENCCGCNACGDVCPTKAISFETDIEGFWYPKVNPDTCINCELCTRICPEINIAKLKHNDFKEPASAIGAINTNMYERWNSTSGGAYSAMADYILENGGYVSGAVYTDDFAVENYVTNSPDDMPRLRSSKYLESYAEGLYKKIESLLKNGETVLACGTPCQMSALRSYLRKDYDNLIVVDFVCRGVNSPKVYRKYLDSLEAKFGSKIVAIKAKNKELGWRNLTRKVTFENGQKYYGVLMEDDFRRGYHTNVYCRPSCYKCVFKGFPRMSDITIGDFWGIEKYAPNLDNNIGTSLILLNSRKGELFFDKIKSRLEFVTLPLSDAFQGNPALHTPIGKARIDRESFFSDLDKSDFNSVVDKYFPIKTSEVSSNLIRRLRSKAGLVRRVCKILKYDFKAIRNTYLIAKRENTFSKPAVDEMMYVMPGVTVDIHPNAKIAINIPVKLGDIPVKGMRMPTCLRMTAGTSLNITGGDRDRYGSQKNIYSIKYGAYIEIVNGGTLTIKSGAVNVGFTVMCAKEITIGSGVRIGRNVSIRDWNGPHVIVSEHYRNHAPVHIGDRVWLCTGCSIMPGVTIGDGAVIGAGAIVTRDIPPRSLAVGSPAKVVKSDIEWY